MGNEGSPGTLPAAKLDELFRLLKAGLFEDFMKMFKTVSKGMSGEGPVTLAELINKKITDENPECETKIVVSQQTSENKYLVMIMDNSAFFGDSWTITRNMFTV